MKKHWLTGLVLAFFVIGCVNVGKTERCLQTLEAGVVRLHILAASDAPADQERKLSVRDALLAHSPEWMCAGDSAAEVLARLAEQAPEMQRIAERVLAESGCTDAVTVSLCEMPFPARTYDTVTLPAGTYHAVRLCIGAGAGANWWCVMYPSLCVPVAAKPLAAHPDETAPTAASTALQTTPSGAGASQTMESYFDAAVCELVTEPQRFTVRLKCVELWRALRAWLQSPE